MNTILPIVGLSSFAMLIIGLFSPKTSLFWLKDQSKRTRLVSSAIYGIVFAICLASTDTAAKTNTSTATQADSDKMVLVTVVNEKGSGVKNTAPFALVGENTKIKYGYRSDNDMMGTLAIYVVPVGTDINTDGGIPEIMITKLKDEGESYLQKPNGKYYLHVVGTGDWHIIIEEQRPLSSIPK